MSKLKKIFLVLLVLCVTSFSAIAGERPRDIQEGSGNPFFPTQADMLNYSNYMIEESDALFEKICNRIIKTYANDKHFVIAFKTEKEAYKKNRLLKRNTVFPEFKYDGSYYGSNYGIYSHSYMIELNEQEIAYYKRMLSSYCFYNEPKNIPCTDKDMEKIFKVN